MRAGKGPLLGRLLGDRGTWIFLALLAALTLIVPVCNLALSPEHPLYVSGYLVALLGKYLTYALLAVATTVRTKTSPCAALVTWIRAERPRHRSCSIIGNISHRSLRAA